ncbi:MAG: alpha/beta hydrolase, partial [Acidimicrobiia bacterium]|nr:alpha/beta hydrolase [Acidimicrobiia bacterium]
AATIRGENADLPGRWVLFPIKKGNLRTVSFLGLMESTTEAPIANAPQILDSWLAAEHGDASGLWFGSLAGDLLLPRMFVWGQYAAFGSIDQQAARDYFAGGPQGRDTNLGYAASATIWGGGQLADAWPAAAEVEKYQEVPTSPVETLLIGGPLDFSTPPQNATRDLLPHLPNGHQVVLQGFGHSFTFWTEQPEAGTRLITAFLDRGQVDDSLYRPQPIDFTPSPTGRGIAKLVVAVLGLLAFLAIASLSGVWLRVQRRGHFGRVASSLLRSLWPIVVGLGGWSAAVLGILIVSRSVPIDDTLLTVLAIGVSVGLAVSLAWVDRDRSPAAHGTGLAAALAGGLIGAWLGLKAIDIPLVNVITGIAGAAVGANLLLLCLDIGWEQRRPGRGRVAAAVAGRPSPQAPATVTPTAGATTSSPSEPTGV